MRIDGLPPSVDPLLDVTTSYEPAIGTGVNSYATHGAVVAVDPETGSIELLDFAVAEDCGTMVKSDARRGPDPGRCGAGHRHCPLRRIPCDDAGQPLARTLADYLLPGAVEMQVIKIGHLHTPTPHTE
jgi:carbon-monoxide dehydrogenase large subunit